MAHLCPPGLSAPYAYIPIISAKAMDSGCLTMRLNMPPGEDAPLEGERCSCSLQMGLRPRCRTSCQRHCYGEEWLSSYGSDGYRRKAASRQRTSYTCNATGGKIDFPILPQMQVQKKQARLKCRACCFCL